MARKSPYFTQEHEEFRESVQRFVAKEIVPHVAAWEETGGFPRDVLRKLGDMGYLGINYPEAVGGADLDFFYSVVMLEELARCGVAGFPGAVAVHSYMATPPLLALGSDRVKQEFLVPAIAGDKIGALAITEPDCGSDVAALRTKGVREGDHYVVDGAKTFITNGCVADFVTVAVRTSPASGHDGISVFVIDTKTPGYRVTKKLKKLGWHSSDTAEITFDHCIVPAENMLGQEGQGFYYLMNNFRIERLVAAVLGVGAMQWILDESLEYALTRKAFGRPVAKFQVLRHRFADMETEIEAARQLTYHAAWLYDQGEAAIREITMAKLMVAELGPRVADRCLQMYGGYGFMEEYPAARAYRDSRLGTIGGGTSEIMREILCGILIDQRGHERVVKVSREEHETTRGGDPAAKGAGEVGTGGKSEDVQAATAGNGQVARALQSLPSRLKADRVVGWNARFLFEVAGGGTFTVWIHDGQCEVFQQREGTPTCTVETDAETFLAIERGTLKAEAAFMGGRIRISNVGEMMKFAGSFERTPPH